MKEVPFYPDRNEEPSQVLEKEMMLQTKKRDEPQKDMPCFAVFEDQFKRGMINMAGGQEMIDIPEEGGWMRRVLKNSPEEVIGRFQKTRTGIFIIFSRYEYAHWFEDGLSY